MSELRFDPSPRVIGALLDNQNEAQALMILTDQQGF